MLAQGERTRVLRIGTDREGRGLARLAVARRERLGVMAGVIGWLLVWTTEAKAAESPSQVDSKDSKARKPKNLDSMCIRLVSAFRGQVDSREFLSFPVRLYAWFAGFPIECTWLHEGRLRNRD